MLQRPTTDTLRAAAVAVATAVPALPKRQPATPTGPHVPQGAPAPPAPPAPPAKRRAPGGRLKRSVRSLLTPEQMNLAIQRESARVDRKSGGGGMLVLVLFRFDGSAAAPSTMRLAKTVLHRIRVTDDVGWFDEQHVGVLLPQTSPAGAWRLAQHVCDRVARRGQRPHVIMYSYGGARPADDGEAPTILRQTDEPAVPKARAG